MWCISDLLGAVHCVLHVPKVSRVGACCLFVCLCAFIHLIGCLCLSLFVCSFMIFHRFVCVYVNSCLCVCVCLFVFQHLIGCLFIFYL